MTHGDKVSSLLLQNLPFLSKKELQDHAVWHLPLFAMSALLTQKRQPRAVLRFPMNPKSLIEQRHRDIVLERPPLLTFP